MRQIHFYWNDRLLRRQPPIRLLVCPGTARGHPGCTNTRYCPEPRFTCPLCGWTYCKQHMRTHVRRFSVPRDAWRGTLLSIRLEFGGLVGKVQVRIHAPRAGAIAVFQIDGKTLHGGAPARITYCLTPTSGNTKAACGHASKACNGTPTACACCEYPYCAHHAPRHQRHLVLPNHYWNRIQTQYRREFTACLRRPRRPIRVRAPRWKP